MFTFWAPLNWQYNSTDCRKQARGKNGAIGITFSHHDLSRAMMPKKVNKEEYAFAAAYHKKFGTQRVENIYSNSSNVLFPDENTKMIGYSKVRCIVEQ